MKCCGLEQSNFSRQLKLKPGINDNHQVIVGMSNDLWFTGMEIKEEGEKRQYAKETKAQLEAMILRTKPEVKQMAALDPSNSNIGHGRFRARLSDDHDDSRLPCKRIELS